MSNSKVMNWHQHQWRQHGLIGLTSHHKNSEQTPRPVGYVNHRAANEHTVQVNKEEESDLEK